MYRPLLRHSVGSLNTIQASSSPASTVMLLSARTFVTSASIRSKASKTRGKKLILKRPPSLHPANVASTARTTSSSNSLLEAEDVPVDEIKEGEAEQMDAAIDPTSTHTGTPAGTPTAIASSTSSTPIIGSIKVDGEEETIYTAPPPYNVALFMTAFVSLAVFSLNAAEMAGSGYSSYDEETDEYVLASKWKRYTFAGGFIVVATGLSAWATLAPGRIITKLTIRRAASTPSSSTNFSTKYPSNSVISIHTPFTKFPIVGGKPRSVEFSKLRLLGPISDGPRSWHPMAANQSSANKKQRNDPISKSLRYLSTLLIPPPKSSSSTTTRWSTTQSNLSHVPLLVQGDRFSYTLGKRRGKLAGSKKGAEGAWCEDWEGLEKALLGVPEKRKN